MNYIHVLTDIIQECPQWIDKFAGTLLQKYIYINIHGHELNYSFKQFHA